jgi:hypothetical protein
VKSTSRDTPQERIPTSELFERLSEAGYPTSDRQLERWRNEELLPAVDQEHIYRGSVTWHPPGTMRQVIAIQRVMRAKKRFDFIGPLLWAAGFDVGERHYAERLEKSDRAFRRIRPLIRALVRKVEASNPDRTLGDEAGPLNGFTGLLAKIFRRLDGEAKPRFVNVVADVASGEFDRFDMPATDREIETSEVMNQAVGFEHTSKDQVLGSRLRLGDALEGTLKELSEIQGAYRFCDFSSEEVQSARDDVRNALKIAICLHDALAWIYGPSAFGLRLPAFFARTVPTHFIFLLTSAFARLRRSGAKIYSSVDIADQARQAEGGWLISTYFRDLSKSRPDLAHLISSKKMKIAFSGDGELRDMLKELAGHQFPVSEFKPWTSWQKLAKQTMSPGLLVTSIGAPEQLSLEQVRANGGGRGIR